MFKKTDAFEQLECEYYRNQKSMSFEQALKIYTALWEHAQALNIIPLSDPLEGIEVDLRIARILNTCLKNS